jgi:hypothetical protein
VLTGALVLFEKIYEKELSKSFDFFGQDADTINRAAWATAYKKYSDEIITAASKWVDESISAATTKESKQVLKGFVNKLKWILKANAFYKWSGFRVACSIICIGFIKDMDTKFTGHTNAFAHVSMQCD